MNEDEKTSSGGGGRKGWDDLVFSAIEKLASAPQKLKDPKESVSQAFDWMKGIRDDIQQRILAEVTDRLRQIDWEAMGKKVGEHLADRYDIEVTSRVSLKRKASAPRDSADEEALDEEVLKQSPSYEEDAISIDREEEGKPAVETRKRSPKKEYESHSKSRKDHLED